MPLMSEKYLIMVTLNNNNKYYKMLPDSDGKGFTVIYGRVGNEGQKNRYPAKDWDKIYRSKINKGYVDQTAIMKVTSEEEMEEFLPIVNSSVRKLVEELQRLAKQTVRTNYRISATQVTQAMIDEAEELLRQMSYETDKVRFNRTLLKLFEIIPRKMANVMSFTARTDGEMAKIVQREQDLLDVMKGQMQTGNVIKAKENTHAGTILDALGIGIAECSKKELEEIKSHLDPDTRAHFKNAWAVKNNKTEAAFEKYIKEKGIKDYRYYYHGSRSENWWSILNNGLKLNPTNAVITGKMFGQGIYFAPKAKKSLGYTSVRGAYWTHGNATTGYLAVYKIAYGKPYDVHDFQSSFYSYDKNTMKRMGADCLHAHAGAMLQNDEVVIYHEDAATIRYLIALS